MSADHILFFRYEFVTPEERAKHHDPHKHDPTDHIIYQEKCKNCDNICHSDKSENESLFIHQIYSGRDVIRMREFLAFHFENTPVDKDAFLDQAEVVIRREINYRESQTAKLSPLLKPALKWIKKKRKELNPKEDNKKIKWKGKPGQLAYIMQQLQLNGFIEAPTLSSGDVNHKQFAELLIATFKNAGALTTLRKHLNPDDEQSISEAAKSKFEFPHIKEL